MKRIKVSTLLLLTIVVVWSCAEKQKKEVPIEVQTTRVEMTTSMGTMQIELYNDTPLHRDNFIKLANEKRFDSLLFHRVIQNFMVQTGDPDSRTAKVGDTLGEGDLDYMVDAEINPKRFHKKGALGAARDGNLKRASSAMQFYLVQGRVFNDSVLKVQEKRINTWLAEHYYKNDPANSDLVNALLKAEDAENDALQNSLNDSIRKLAASYTNFERYTIPDAHREVYKTVGGTPHLDQNYTVFGQVVTGLDVIDAIAAMPTNSMDRPVEDVRVLMVRVLED